MCDCSSCCHDTEASVTALGEAARLINRKCQLAHLIAAVFISQVTLSIIRVVAACVILQLRLLAHGRHVSIVELLIICLHLLGARLLLLLLYEALLFLVVIKDGVAR